VSRILVIKGWAEFQHYKDRDPPWIKLYRDTLTSEVWVLGTDISRLVQVASTLLAARYKNKTPINYELWREVAKIRCTEQEFEAAIKHLCKWKFAVVQQVADDDDEDASEPLAECATVPDALYSEGEQSRAEAEQRESRGARENVPRETFDGWKFVDERLRPAYPRGTFRHTHWLTASRAVEQLVSDGADPDEIAAMATAYCAQQEAMGNAGTQYVMAPTKFLADENWRGPFDVPKPAAKRTASVADRTTWRPDA
jgi:hypothetical protein